MAIGMTYRFEEPKSMEEVQREINALTHSEFMHRVACYLSTGATFGVVAYTFGGHLTPNAKMLRAMCLRLARINGEIEFEKAFRKDFDARDRSMKEQAEAAANVPPPHSGYVWIDSESLTKLNADMSTTRALLTTYAVPGCVPLKPLTPEELASLKDTPL